MDVSSSRIWIFGEFFWPWPHVGTCHDNITTLVVGAKTRFINAGFRSLRVIRRKIAGLHIWQKVVWLSMRTSIDTGLLQ